MINVPLGEWEKIPRLQAKTSVGPQGRGRDRSDLIEGPVVVPTDAVRGKGFILGGGESRIDSTERSAAEAAAFRRSEPSLDGAQIDASAMNRPKYYVAFAILLVAVAASLGLGEICWFIGTRFRYSG